MVNKKVNFVAHARLKDIVGRGLINDDNVAIIELIKNSKDAQSKSVDIYFTDARRAKKESMLVIQDFGRGMNLEDLQYKWLNIAYSEKKDSQPDDGGAYAGNKGIGRFACDRLGKKLSLFTRQKNGDLLRLDIDWTKFEVDDRDTQIGKIPTVVRSITFDEFAEETDGLGRFTHGTTLVVRSLRSNWPKGRLLRLRKELERFAFDPKRDFSITLIAEDYEGDSDVNGEIENKIFENLDFRTTSLVAEIPEDGSKIDISLRHDGDEVFGIEERNPYGSLSNVKVTIFYLNQAAKAYFRRRTGYRSVDFGSIFLFLNGFRVMPYGEESDDWLGLDHRKQQGVRRFLSTRDLVGYIEIVDTQGVFLPVSSREGLVHNEAFTELTSESQTVRSAIDNEKLYGLFHKVFRKLERFVVDGLDWDRITTRIRDTDDDSAADLGKIEYDTSGRKIFDTMIPTITIRSPKSHIKNIDVNLPYVVQIAEQEISSYDDFVDSLNSRFKDTSVSQLTPADKRSITGFIKKQTRALAAKERAAMRLERQNIKLAADRDEKEVQLRVETKRRLFAEVESTSDQRRIIQMLHQVGLLSGKVYKVFDRTIRKYRENPDKYSKEKLVELIEKSIFDIDKIRKVSKFASKASFDVSTNRVKEDLIQFVEEYIESFNDLSLDWNLKVDFENPSRVELVRRFRPIELSMLVDNLIDNAGKASARKLDVSVRKRAQKVSIFFTDNGRGLSKRFKPDELFHSGISSTDGSGIGLSHVRQIVEEIGGAVSISNNDGRGATVRIDLSAE